MILLGAVIAAAIASLVSDLGQLDLANRAVDGERITLSEASDSDDAVGLAATIYTIAVVLCAISFLLWYSRAYRNLPGLGRRDPRYGPRWAVAYWFIPIVCLFRPKQVMNDIWRGSDPDNDAEVGSWHQLPVSPLLHWWWGLWLLDTFIVPNPFGGTSNTAQDLQSEFTRYVIVDALDIVVAILAILVVRRTTDRQEQRRRRVELGESSLAGTQPPPPEPLPATSG